MLSAWPSTAIRRRDQFGATTISGIGSSSSAVCGCAGVLKMPAINVAGRDTALPSSIAARVPP